MKKLFYIAIGGAIGSVLRYLTSVLVNKYWSTSFPLATFLTNVVGCFLIGFLMGILENNYLTNSNLKWFLITGFCGGFTTFSTFGLENINLFHHQNSAMAFLYVGASVIVGLASVWLGLFVTKL